jgi:hypothetical protein
VLDGVAGDSTVLGYHNLAIDRFQVTVDRARTDHELFGHFSIGKSPGHQTQHLHFSGVSTKVSFENYQPLSIKSFPAIASRRSAVCPKRQWTMCLPSYLCTILAQDLGYVLLHSPFAGNTGICVEDEQYVESGR